MESIWTKTAGLPAFAPLQGDRKTDVLVIGGGVAGLLTAYAMHTAGIRCLLVEAGQLCGGVTANTTAKITSQHGLTYAKLLRLFGPERARAYWQANEEALRRYALLAGRFPCEFEKKDAYVYSLADRACLDRELNALRRLEIPADYTANTGLPMETAGAVRFRDQAQFHPLKFLAGIAGELDICEGTAVRAFEGNTVLTGQGKITAEHIVVATHFPMLNKHGAYFLKLYQSRSYVLAMEGVPPLDGMYLDAEEGGLSLRSSGRYLLLGSGGHRTGKLGGGWEKAEAFARKYHPSAAEAGRWATQDCMSLDGVPYVGRYGRRTHNLYVAAGFNKWGMTSAMAAAELLRDMVLDRENPYEKLFLPQRSMLRPQLAANALEAVGSLLRFSGPRCPHMGCALKWNERERSWDCPCHGSRFAADGQLLDNPATGPISPPPGHADPAKE